jgi:tetratricopeptide (TPR) repeat protein
MTRLRPRLARRSPAFAFAVCAAFHCLGCHKTTKAVEATAERGTVQRVAGQGASANLEICDPKGAACSAASEGATVPAGSVLRTAERASAEIAFASGNTLSLDHDSELFLPSNAGRHARLSHGSLVIELAGKAPAHARFDFEGGSAELAGGKAALRTGADFAILDVIRGSATLSASDGKPLQVNAGEEARLYRGSAPYVSSGAALAEAVAFTDHLLEQSEDSSQSKGLGELSAKKPGSTDELRGAVKLASHSVKVRIAGAMARTQIDEVFENTTDDVLEGIYRFPIPTDAKIERLALEVDGKLEEGAFVDRDRAASIWRGAIVHAAPSMRQQITDDIVWVPGPWRDPALLEWQRGGRFELRIFPIPKRGQRRIVLAYTEAVRPVGGVRRFTYPLPVDPGGTTKIRHFDLDLEVRGEDPKFGVRALGYPLSASDRDGARAFSLNADNFSPNGDLSVEWALPDRQSELTSFGYRAADERFALLTLRPKLPRVTNQAPHATAIIVDSSRSMYGEGFERAKKLAARLTRELDPASELKLLSCDSTCRELPHELTPGPAAASEVARFLAGITAEGASDLTQSIASANSALATAPSTAQRDIIYIGDGTPTVGPIRPATVTSAVEDALSTSRARVTAVAVGATSDLESLAAIARAGGGLVLPYAPGQTLNEAVLGVVGATYGSALRDVEVTLPDGLQTAAPEKLDTILAGGEANISARMSADHVDGSLIVRGKVGTAPFEQRYPVHVSATDNARNAFVPRIYAAARIADLEQTGNAEAKKEAIALSTEFKVQSRYTSLLVLESEAMFQAFGLKASEPGSTFTGEDLAEKSDAKGELEVEGAKDDESELDRAAIGASNAAGADKKSITTTPTPTPTTAGGAGMLGAASEAAAAPKMARAARPEKQSLTQMTADGFASPPPPAAAAPAPAPAAIAAPSGPRTDLPFERVPPPRRRMIPMRRVWDRKGQIITTRFVPLAASVTAVADAERALAADPDRRSAVKKAYSLYAASADLGRAASLVERWAGKEPLDPDALTARADLAARRGDRELAVRILGSVVDVRPDDVASQKRLARLYRWSGRADLGCRHSMAIAELRVSDPKLLADALRCARGGNATRWASDALALVDEKTAHAAEALAAQPAPDDTRLLGDLRVEATWSDDADLDLALLHPDGHRVSWLGAPTREVISARDVLDHGHEGLALNGAKPGEYAVEIVRSAGVSGPIRGEVTIFAAGEARRVPFTLEGQRVTVALAEIKMVPRLVPLELGLPAIAE